MPLAQLKSVDFEAPAPAAAWPRANVDATVATGSPAHMLQQRLEAHVAPDPAFARWPARRTLALVVGSSVALWAAILEAGSLVIHAIA